MEQRKVWAIVMFVMAYGLATTTFPTTSEHLPVACDGYEPLIDTCEPDLTISGSKFNPSNDCCYKTYYAFTLAMADKTGKGIINICNCFQFAIKTLKYDPNKIIRLPDACGLQISFPISKCVYNKYL